MNFVEIFRVYLTNTFIDYIILNIFVTNLFIPLSYIFHDFIKYQPLNIKIPDKE